MQRSAQRRFLSNRKQIEIDARPYAPQVDLQPPGGRLQKAAVDIQRGGRNDLARVDDVADDVQALLDQQQPGVFDIRLDPSRAE